MTSRFKKLLQKENPIIFDGAMGTNLQKKGIPRGLPPEALNLREPEKVKAVHLSYVEAGVDVILTNTFGANRFKLSRWGMEKEVEKVNKRGVEIAKNAAGSKCLVGASIGPLGVFIEPLGDFKSSRAREIFKEQIKQVAEAGVDLIVLETFMGLEEAELAISVSREVTELPLICQFTFGGNGKTIMGLTPEKAASVCKILGVDAVGANCGVGPEKLFEVAERFLRVSSLPVIIQPNAGEPKFVKGETIFPAGPEEMAEWAEKLIRAGVKIIGGCCGTDFRHLKAMVKRIKP